MSKKNEFTTNGHLSDAAAKKPIAITQDGKFILPGEMREAVSLAVGSFYSLDTSLQQKLTLERIKVDPKYNLGIFSLGMFKRDEVIAEVEDETELGQLIIQAEMNYCSEFVAATLPTDKAVTPPKVVPEEAIMPPWKPEIKRLPLWVKNTALFCENTTDAVTKYAAQYRIAHVHPAFVARGFKVVVLQGVDDERTHFVNEAKKAFVVYIGGIGHGGPSVYTGNLGNHILEVGAYDPAEVRNKVFHFLSCQTAKQLGPDVVAKAGKAYAGYFENFTFVYDSPSTPSINEMDLFWRADSTFDLYMASGSTVEEAHNATIVAYNAAIAQVPNTAAATWLLWDRNYFRTPVINAIYGSKTVKVSPLTSIWIPVPLEIEKLETAELAEELVKA